MRESFVLEVLLTDCISKYIQAMLRACSLSQAVAFAPRALSAACRVTLKHQALPSARWPAPSHGYSSNELHLEDISGSPVDLRVYNHATLRTLAGEITSSSQLTTVHIYILGTGGNEVAPSFLLDCYTGMYLFNCGEGWVRNLTSKMKRPLLFFSRAAWENFSGCCGLYHHMEYPQLEYCGPPKSDEFIDYISRYNGRDTWRNVVQWDSENNRRMFEDKNLSMTFIEIDSEEARDLGSLVAYSCKLADVDGKFQPEKAAELGIEPGPAYKLLAHGFSVITKTGDLIQPSQVVQDKRKGPTFLVVDCPNERFLGPVTSNPQLQPEWFSEREQSVSLIVHITPLGILESEQYCKWMAGFGHGTKHLFLHGSVCPGEVGYRAAMTFSLPFHLLNPNVYHFPCLPDSSAIPKSDLAANKYLGEDSITIGRMFMKYHLKPQLLIDTSECLESHEDQVRKDLKKLKGNHWVYNRILDHRRRLSVSDTIDVKSVLEGSLSPPRLTDPKDALVTILGTSAAYSGKWRNVSGILVQTLRDGNVLLDCGEGTLCQLHRAFGRTATKDILQKLKVIFISHDHLDHHLGLIGVLKEVQSLNRGCDSNGSGLTIIADLSFLQMLKRYRSKCEKILQFEGIDICDTAKSPFSLNKDVTMKTVPSNHTQNCHSILLRKRNKWSIVYSSDTRPSRYLAKKGYGANLLIHEGTYVSNTPKAASDAKLNKHSTYFEAVRVGELMNAQFTIVTHFSTRYSLDALLLRDSFAATCPAVDLMSVKLSDLNRQLLDSELCHTAVRGIGRYSKKLIFR